jgi:hypothetical protein
MASHSSISLSIQPTALAVRGTLRGKLPVFCSARVDLHPPTVLVSAARLHGQPLELQENLNLGLGALHSELLATMDV